MSGFSEVSIIIVNYNAGQLLARCIESVIGQVDEVIIVDNASTDQSLVPLELLSLQDTSIRLIKNFNNLGFAAACNIGANMAKERYLFFLNPDCELSADAIENLLKAIKKTADIGMVGGLLLNADGSEQGGGRRAVPTPWRSFVRAFGLSRLSSRWPRLFYDFHLHKQLLPKHEIEVEAVSGACMLVSRLAITDVGLWDDKYFLHCEDLDWCMRFRQKKWKILFVPSARVLHHQGACGRSRPLFVEWHKHKGMLRFYQKFFSHQYPGLLMWIVCFGVWLRFFGIFILITSRDLSKRIVNSK